MLTDTPATADREALGKRRRRGLSRDILRETCDIPYSRIRQEANVVDIVKRRL
jgi:hypothetical protein